MSFWSKINTTINDLEIFKNTCRDNQIEYHEVTGQRFQNSDVHAILKASDVRGGIMGYLVKDGGGFKVVMDRDGSYSNTARRLGGNGDFLCRDYTSNYIETQTRKAGGMIIDRQYHPDGSITLRCVNG